MFEASIALLLRSFCEVVIVGQLERHPAHIQTITRARDATYGLFSLCFIIFITFAVPKRGGGDPLIEKEKAAVQEAKTWVIQRLDEMTEHGRKTAPTISTLFHILEEQLQEQNDQSQDDSDSSYMKLMEIKRLRKFYAGWEPIYKWQEEAYKSETRQDNVRPPAEEGYNQVSAAA